MSLEASEGVKSPAQSVGPDYRPEKPIATVSTPVSFENVHTLPQTPQLIALLTYVKEMLHIPIQHTYLHVHNIA